MCIWARGLVVCILDRGVEWRVISCDATGIGAVYCVVLYLEGVGYQREGLKASMG